MHFTAVFRRIKLQKIPEGIYLHSQQIRHGNGRRNLRKGMTVFGLVYGQDYISLLID
jgi:hypothetical protein